jgi:uracil phosphoribosyltransferase
MEFKNLHVLNHPLIQQKLFYLRDKRTSSLNFRNTLNEISGLMVYEITRNIAVRPKALETPLEKTTGYVLAKKLMLVPILRAGLAMCDGILALIPNAKVGHIGLYRDKKSHSPIEYYQKLPPHIADAEILVIDPMLATGGSASTAVDIVKKAGGSSIIFVCLVAAPEGVEKLHNDHPEIPVYTAALDRELSSNKYILPGLGDAGDRIYGTQ